MKKQLFGLMALAMMGQEAMGDYHRPVKRKNKEKVIPKGCKEYFFDKYGDFSFIKHNAVVYSCVASNKKTAKKKFYKSVFNK